MTHREEYKSLLNSGFFWEFYPQLTGEWEKDKEEWEKILEKLDKFRNNEL